MFTPTYGDLMQTHIGMFAHVHAKTGVTLHGKAVEIELAETVYYQIDNGNTIMVQMHNDAPSM